MIMLAGMGTFATAQDGEKLFRSNCASCHSIGKGKVVGPDLKGINDIRDEKWLISWIKSSQKLIKEGDTLAKRVYAENGNVPMPDAFISEAEIKTVLSYIKTKSDEPATVAVNNPQTTPAPVTPGVSMPMIKFSFTEYLLAGMIVFLL
ncbi:MAG: cytochrome c, partial [Bacteroidota bacterium]